MFKTRLVKALCYMVFTFLIILLISCNSQPDDIKPEASITTTPVVTTANAVTSTVHITYTPKVTGTVAKTSANLQTPTSTQLPTRTPTPKPTPTPTPTPSDYIVFSHKSGFYANEFSLKLDSTHTIYYTTDNSIPTTSSWKYVNAFPIKDKSSSSSADDGATVIRAAAFIGNSRIGPVYTYTYIVNRNYSSFNNRFKNMPVVSLSTDKNNLYNSSTGIFTNYKQHGREWERPCHIEFFDSNGKTGFAIDGGLRVYGGTSRGSALKSLKLFARKEYDEENGKFKHPLFPDRKNIYGETVDRYDTFILRAGGNDNVVGGHRATNLRDGIIHHLAGRIENLDFQEFRPCVVYINGEYWGIMNIRDDLDNDYIQEHYDLDKEKLAIIAYGHENGLYFAKIDEGTQTDLDAYNYMISYISSNDMRNQNNYNTAKDLIDIESFIRYMLVNVFANNRDWPGNNLRAWKYIGEKGSKYGEDGKWRFMLKDIDYSWGRYTPDGPGANVLAEETGHARNVLSGGAGTLSTMLGQLLKNIEFRNMFINFMCDMTSEYFSTDTIIDTVNNYANIINDEMKNHLTNNWNGYTPKISHSSWLNNVEDLREYGRKRPNVMVNLIKSILNITNDSVKVNIKVINSSYGTIKMNTVEIINKSNWQGTYYKSINVPFTVTASKGHSIESILVSGSSNISNNVLSINDSGEITITVKFK